MRFEAVAFDLDGTLYPAHRIYALAFPRMLRVARRLAVFNATRRHIRRLGSDGARRAAPTSGGSFRALQAELFAGRLGLDEAEAGEIIDRVFYRDIEELFSKVRLFDGLAEALDAIEGAGLRLALLSDLPPVRKLELLGLAGRFDPALCSEDSGFLKPSLEPFAMLASRLGSPPERILYVGNSARIDVAGAKNAGMSAAIVSRRSVAYADLHFWDWRRLADFAVAEA